MVLYCDITDLISYYKCYEPRRLIKSMFVEACTDSRGYVARWILAGFLLKLMIPKLAKVRFFFYWETYVRIYAKKPNLTLPILILKRWRNTTKYFQTSKKMYALNLLLLIQMLSNNKKKVMRGVKMYLWDWFLEMAGKMWTFFTIL